MTRGAVFFGIAISILADSYSHKPMAIVWPISGSQTTMDVLSSGYGPRWLLSPAPAHYDFHRGVDIVASYQTVYAITGGKVVYYDYRDGFGNYLVIAHGDPDSPWCYSGYAHLNKAYVSIEETVTEGQAVAQSGARRKPGTVTPFTKSARNSLVMQSVSHQNG